VNLWASCFHVLGFKKRGLNLGGKGTRGGGGQAGEKATGGTFRWGGGEIPGEEIRGGLYDGGTILGEKRFL